MGEEIDGIPIDRGPSGVSQAAAPPPEGDKVVQPPATQDDPPASPDANATPPGDGTGDPATPNNDGTDPAGVYSAETVAAREAAAEERGKQAALAQLQEAKTAQVEQTLKDEANESYRINTASQRELLAAEGITDEKTIQKIMGPVDTHNRFVVTNAFKVALGMASQEYADNLTSKLGDKATEFWNANGGKPEAVSDIIDRYADARGPDLPWFKNGKPEDLLEMHKQLKAYVLTKIDDGIEDYKKANRPTTQPVNNEQERTPTGPVGLASYKATLQSGGKLPDAKDIDAMTKNYLESLQAAGV